MIVGKKAALGRLFCTGCTYPRMAWIAKEGDLCLAINIPNIYRHFLHPWRSEHLYQNPWMDSFGICTGHKYSQHLLAFPPSM